MTYTEYYKGFLIEIWQDFTFPKPNNWIYGVHVDFDAWLRKGYIGTDFETALRNARYEVMAYIALERIPAPHRNSSMQVNQGGAVMHSTWYRSERLWYYRWGNEPWLSETQMNFPNKEQQRSRFGL